MGSHVAEYHLVEHRTQIQAARTHYKQLATPAMRIESFNGHGVSDTDAVSLDVASDTAVSFVYQPQNPSPQSYCIGGRILVGLVRLAGETTFQGRGA